MRVPGYFAASVLLASLAGVAIAQDNNDNNDNNNNNNAGGTVTLDPGAVATGSAQNGQQGQAEENQAESLT